MPKPVTGSWVWVHYPPKDAAELIARLKACGATGVLLKYHEGASPTDNTGYDYQASFRALVGPLKDAGLRVAAWGYNYPGRAADEAALIAQAFKDGAEWYCFDIESEFEGHQSDAQALVEQVRLVCPTETLGYAPFPFADYHGQYPYAILDAACDLCLPQVYAGLLADYAKDAQGNRVLDIDGDYNHTYLSIYGGEPLALKHATFLPNFSVDDGETQANIARMAALAQNGGFAATAWWVLDDCPPAAQGAIAATPYGRSWGQPTPATLPAEAPSAPQDASTTPAATSEPSAPPAAPTEPPVTEAEREAALAALKIVEQNLGG